MATTLTAAEAARTGMTIALIARDAPTRPALLSPHGERDFATFNARCNAIVRVLRRAGLKAGDAVALLAGNRPEFVEVTFAAMRAGLRLTPVNWHLKPDEVAYVVEDCDARALIAQARFADAALASRAAAPALEACLSFDGAIPGFDDLESAIAAESGDDIPDPELGSRMLYTSGTTGRPKGVRFLGHRKVPLIPPLTASAGFRPESDLFLNPSPLYHAAPIGLSVWWPLNQGVGLYLMDRFDAEEMLALIARHRVTHSHVVPVMLQRMLDLPAEVRDAHDISSLRWMLHGSAPCSRELKDRAIAWLGPILHEFFGGTEGGLVFSSPADWQSHPGCTGRPVEGVEIRILTEEGEEQPTGETGLVYLKPPESDRFVYHKAPEKTAQGRRGEFFTMGDMGRVDADGYLYLTGRSADTVISGGVNIYPAEIDAVLNGHPAVKEAACVGVPSARWGEEVKAVIQLNEGFAGDEALIAELTALCREKIADYKCPKSFDFVDEMPRSAVGKVLRRDLRDRYWPEQAAT